MGKHLYRKPVKTADGSDTFFIPELNEHYHSRHGALQESCHVFVGMGLDVFKSMSEITVFEVGFGTGLNSLLAYEWAHEHKTRVCYISIEKYPLSEEEYSMLDYSIVSPNANELLGKMHKSVWDTRVEISEYFILHKIEGDLNSRVLPSGYDCVFFDAFAPEKQPDLWESSVFRLIFNKMNCNGILVTYCAKGQVRRNMIEAGFQAERLQGPPGKREMLRGIKIEV